MSGPDDIASRFEEIYNSTNKELLTYITSKCGRIADVSDIFQDTCMEFYRVLCERGIDYVTNAKALLFKIAKRKIAKHYSLSERLRMFVPLYSQSGDSEEFEMPDIEAGELSTEDIVVNQVMLEEAKKLIMQKPENVKKVFFLFYEVGQTIPEIAQALSMSESNVKHKLYRTLNEIREILN